MEVSAVDLFCGAGGLTYGLAAAGISVEAGFDIDEECRYAYESNNDAEFVQCDLGEIAKNDPGRIGEHLDDSADMTLVAGCAPCQPFSPLNHGKESSEHEMYGLLSAFGEIVEHVQPDFVVMENVYEVRDANVYDDFVNRLDRLGYNINPTHDRGVYCPEYEIPQTRRRWVVMATQEEDSVDIGSPLVRDPARFKTVKQTIDELPELEAGETDEDDPIHTARKLSETNLRRIRQSEPGGTWMDWDKELRLDCHIKDSGQSYGAVYGRMRPDEPAPTITTQFYNLGSGRFGHYDTDQDRALSLREGAMIQTFSRDYEFAEDVEELGITKIGQMIGNAVPPKLGEVIGDRILQFLDDEDKQRTLNSYSSVP